nr:uncharacterized protein LOC124809973 isoform X2 [Hydra vulgaris]
MAWCRAIWQEHELEEEGDIPSCWVDSEFVYWPSKMNVLSAAKEHAKPDATWHKFKILKVKCYDDDKELCKSYEFSSNDEVQALNKNEPIIKENKIMKYTLKKAASSTTSQKKFEAPPKRFKKLEVTDTGESTLTFPLKDMLEI